MAGAQQLTAVFDELSATLPLAQFPLPLEGSDEARHHASVLTSQVRDYLLPRAASLDAPLLVVVGGSTGAGKSTLVNSLLGASLTRPGILRPTTKSPVLVCHPKDLSWFRTSRILPDLVRSTTQVHDSRALQVIEFDALPPGLAILDAPDIDSVDGANRRLARQLLQAADLWLFVTSGARYADAIGWELLGEAASRNAVVSVILNRCPPDSLEDLKTHLGQMLAARGLPRAKLFAMPERRLPGNGMLPATDVQPIRDWLGNLASQSERRTDVAIQTLAGSVRALDPQLRGLAQAARQQVSAIYDLRRQALVAFQHAAQEVARSTSDGTMLRGEVLSRWQDFVGTGEFMRNVEQQISSWRDRVSGWFTGEQKAESVQVAVSDGLAALIVDHASAACEQTVAQWTLTPWGRDIVAASPELASVGAGFAEQAGRSIREWQGDLLAMVEEQGASKRMKARFLALGTNAIGAALIIVIFASTGGLTTAEVGIAGGTSVLAQRLLEGVFGEDAVRRLAQQAKEQLDARVQGLHASQLARFESVLDQLSIDPSAGDRLDAVARALREASSAAFRDLTKPEGI
ncbi:MAG: ABC transporter [Arachnia sp.]